MKLHGQVAMVTGGATGIGAAIVKRLADDGARVVITDINDAEGIVTAEHTGARFVHCDAAIADEVEETTEWAVKALGSLDILVVAAAHTGGFHGAAEMPEREWRAVMDVSLDGVFHATKHAAAVMKAQERGSIIVIASVEGMTGARNHAAYVTAKSALFGLDPLDGDRLWSIRNQGQCGQPGYHRFRTTGHRSRQG